MTRVRLHQTSFTAGQVAPALLGRSDLRLYQNGAATLTNVLILPTGGVRRRPGLRHVAGLPGRARLIAFEFNTEQVYLLAISDGLVTVMADGETVATLAAPWSETQLAGLTWTQSADTLLVCHPEVEARSLTRHGAADWRLEAWSFAVVEGVDKRPFHRFADAAITLTPSATSGAITLTASAAAFDPLHVDLPFQVAGKQVTITAVASATVASATTVETLDGTGATIDWQEPAWSPLRGWPVSAVFHKDRLVVGGARDLPNRIWISRSADLFNFDTGSGLDDEAIEFPILADQVNAVRAVFSGHDLQVFTAGAEWVVTGEPLSPDSVELIRQTRVGSPTERSVPPRDVDGATLFASGDGGGVHEFLYVDVDSAYTALDLALVAGELVRDPIDQDYDRVGRLLYVVMADGTIGALTAYRAEQVTAWTRLETDGAVGAIAMVGGIAHVAVLRAGVWSVEAFDAAVALDAALTGSDAEGTANWLGLDHLEGREVRVLADGSDLGLLTVAGGAITLPVPAFQVHVGLPFRHVIEPLPAAPFAGASGSLGVALRPVRTIFRLLETAALRVDTGRGPTAIPLGTLNQASGFGTAPAPITGDRTLRHLGWTRSSDRALWRIDQDDPVGFCLLSATTEVKVND
ncbi:MAG: hypothetical protein KDA49_15415 [Rhodospirillaceae bacterium]|nr:hypothetical protein [Rhodospirillaceae bacterium]